MIKKFKRNNIYKISAYKNEELTVSLDVSNVSNKYDIVNKIRPFTDIPDKIIVEDIKGDKNVYSVSLTITSNPYL